MLLKKITLCFAILVAIGMVAVQARAVPISSITYDLISGATTYGTVAIDLMTNTSANITFTDANGFQGSGGNATVALNVNASSFSVTNISPSGGTADILTGDNGTKLGGYGPFDLGIDYSGGLVNSPITFTLTNAGAPPTWTSATDVLRNGSDGVAGAHLYLGSTGLTGWALANGTPPSSVPEPDTLLLLGSALMGLAVYRGLRKA